MQNQILPSVVLSPYLSDQERYEKAAEQYILKKGSDALKSLLHFYKGIFNLIHRANGTYVYSYTYDIKLSMEKGTYDDEKKIWMELIEDMETFRVIF